MHHLSGNSLTPLTGSAKWDILSGLRFLLALMVAATHLSLNTDPGPVRVLAAFGAFEAIVGFLVIGGYSNGSSSQKRPDGFFLRRAVLQQEAGGIVEEATGYARLVTARCFERITNYAHPCF